MPHASVCGVFVDLHLHADGISAQDLSTLAYFGLKAAVTCARDAGAGSAPELIKHWDELVRIQTQRLKMAGIRPFVALALHPSRIPWHGVDDLLHKLPRYFDDPRLVALGELGLQDGTERELDVLRRQLTLAARLRKPAIVHTPGREKLQRTREVIALLKGSPLPPGQVLIDHVSEETFSLARGFGCWTGLTIQPGLFDAERAAAVISRHGAERIVLTSDIGEGATDLLALPKAADALSAAGLSDQLSRRVLWENPLSFVGSTGWQPGT
jgi:predicted metal-dependent TIM-barrel fold hydrolase